MVFPVSVYAAMDHSGHNMGSQNVPSVNSGTNQTNDSLNTQNQHDMGTSTPVQGNHSSGHGGGDTKKNVFEPVKNQIVAGLLSFNAVIVIVALIMKKKHRQGGVNHV